MQHTDMISFMPSSTPRWWWQQTPKNTGKGNDIETKVRHPFTLWMNVHPYAQSWSPCVLHVHVTPIQALNWWCSCRDTTKCEFYNMKIIKVYFQTMWIHAQVFAAADKKKRNWKRPRWPRLPATTHHGCRATEARSRQSNFPQQLISISYFDPITFLDNAMPMFSVYLVISCDEYWTNWQLLWKLKPKI